MNRKKIKKVLFYLTSSAFLFGVGTIILFYNFVTLPSIEGVNFIKETNSVILIDRNNKFLFDFSKNQKKVLVQYENISPFIIKAILAIEDDRFFEHNGLRISSFIRATLVNIKNLSFSQGGSTITQQVVKNSLLTGDKKITRKLKEFILAPKLEDELSKEEILELYFNTIAYGGVVYGIGEATINFFNKKPTEVTLAEAAYLAAIPKAPTYYSPYGKNKTELEKRKDLILERMLSLGWITQEEFIKAKNEVVLFNNREKFTINAPHFVFYVEEKLKALYGGAKGLEGETIKTTLDLELQQSIEKIISNALLEYEDVYELKNIAALVLSTKTGDILSMVGSSDFFNEDISGFVNITTSLRQPGSSIKPFIYTRAFEKGFTRRTALFDVDTEFNPECLPQSEIEKNEQKPRAPKLLDQELDDTEDTIEIKEGLINKGLKCYSPVNYDGKFAGPITIEKALSESKNIPAVKTLYLVGINKMINTLNELGITSFDRNSLGLSLALGGLDVSPLKWASAYTALSNNGVHVESNWLLGKETKKTKIFDSQATKNTNVILSDINLKSSLYKTTFTNNLGNYSIAVKTGTTNNSRDLWVIGYTPEIVVLIWGGNADGAPIVAKNNSTRVLSGLLVRPVFNPIIEKVIRKYSSKEKTFSKPLPQAIPFPVLNGIWYEKDGTPHSVLHFINKKDLNTLPIGDNDSQYENWELGVSLWEKENKELLAEKLINLLKQQKNSPNNKISIIGPANRNLIKGEIVSFNIFSNFTEDATFEYYINEKFYARNTNTNIKINTKNIQEDFLRLKIIVYVEGDSFFLEDYYTLTSLDTGNKNIREIDN